MSLGGAAVLLTIGVGVLAAVGTGLTDGAAGNSAGLAAQWPTQVPEDPTPARAAAIVTRPAVETTPAPDADGEPAPAPVVDPIEPAPAAPSAAMTPAPLPTVRQGDRCSAEGALAVTVAGKPAVCTGKGRTRWRHA
jgi:hypothetical protein